MPKKLSREEFIKKANKKHNNKYDYSKLIYINARAHVVIGCPKHKIFFPQKANAHLNGRGCKLCGKEKSRLAGSLTTKDFIKKANEIHGNKYDYSRVKYIHGKEKVIIGCPSHGFFPQTARNHLSGKGCLYCSGKLKSQNDFINEVVSIYGDKYDFSKTIYKGSDKNIDVYCKRHEKIFSKRASIFRQNKKGSKCFDCQREEEFIEKSKKIFGKRFDYSKSIWRGAEERLIIVCPDHGEVEMYPHVHLRSLSGCRKCSSRGGPAISYEDFKKRVLKKYNDKIEISKIKNFVNSDSKVRVKCKKHNSWKVIIARNLLKNRKDFAYCNYCSNKKTFKDDFIKRANKKHKNKYDYSLINKKGFAQHEELKIICPDHGIFKQKAVYHFKHGCPECAGNIQLTQNDFIRRCNEIHGFKFDYSKTIYKGYSEEITYSCPEHGIITQFAGQHITGRGCMDCGGRKQGTTEGFIKKAIEIHGNLYSYSKSKYININTELIITCRVHGDFYQKPGLHLGKENPSGCPRCINKSEGRIALYLNEKAIVHRQWKIENKRYDYFLPDFNLIIERDGEQHYQTIKFFKKNLQDEHDNDVYKTKLAKKYDFKIARIPYWLDYENEKKEIDNILAGNPSYPDVPDLKQSETKPLPK